MMRITAHLLLLAAVLTPVTPVLLEEPRLWTTYDLTSGGGLGDSETRLTLWLSDALTSFVLPANLSDFTLCLWFKVTTFLDYGTLLSYAVSDMLDDAIRMRVKPDGLSVKYMMENLGRVEAPVSPLRWYPSCLAVSPDQWTVWLGNRSVSRNAPTPSLPLDGLLVLGQEQDELDGGYAAPQSFLGQVTGLTLWGSRLESPEIDAFSQCESPGTEPLISWPDLSWNLHNRTGFISATFASPCDSSDELLLFTTHMTWPDAYRYLAVIGLEMAVPRSHREFDDISLLVEGNEGFCGLASGNGNFSWIGVTANRSTDTFYDDRGAEVRVLAGYKGPQFSFRPADAIFVLQSTARYVDVSTTNRRACFTGRQRQPMRFRVRGECDFLEGFGDSFILSSRKGGGVYFHGYGRLRITKDESTSLWCLHETPTSETEDWNIACITSAELPLGERQWTLRRDMCGKKGNELFSLVLTRCTDDQYTCSDSTCIDLKQMCDYSFNCADRADESACTTVHLGTGYQSTVSPNYPLNLTAYVSIVNIREFDLLSMRFQVHMRLQMLWYDPWITFFHLAAAEEKRVITGTGEIWKPNIAVSNSLETTNTITSFMIKRESQGLASLHGYMYNGSENSLHLEMDIRTTVTCHFELQWYPWDEQQCEIHLKVRNVQQDGLWLGLESAVVQYPDLLEQYQVKNCTLEKGRLSRNMTLSLHLSRRYVYHLWTTFLPTSLLLFLGYGTLYLPADMFNERGTMSLTTMLVFMSLYTETSSSLPSTAYLKHIDVWFVFNLAFLTFIIGIHLATCRGTGEAHQGPRSPDRSRVFVTRGSCDKGGGGEVEGRNHARAKLGALTDPEAVLRGSRVLFAVLFLVFTAVYFILIS